MTMGASGGGRDGQPGPRPALFDEVVARLHEAAAGRIAWRDALEPLVVFTDAWMVELAIYDKASGHLLHDYAAGPAPLKAQLDYLRGFHRLSPRIRPMLALPVGGWFHDHEAFDERTVATDPFYQDFLIPLGGRWMSATKVADHGETMTLLQVQRGLGRPPLAAHELPPLDRIRRFLARALLTQRDRLALRSGLSAGRELLEQYRFATLLVDAGRRLHFANRAAQALLAAPGSPLRLDGRVLVVRNPVDDGRFAALLDDLVLDRPAEGRSDADVRRFLRLNSPGGGPIGVFIVALRPQSTLGAFDRQGLALLAVHDPASRPQLDVEIVAEAFGLSPAEAEVASLLARGLSTEQVAAAKSVGVATVRSQIQALFAKTGTRRQADLVRILASLPVGRLTDRADQRTPAAGDDDARSSGPGGGSSVGSG